METAYKITYCRASMAIQFVRIKDDAILFENINEALVIAYANGFLAGKGSNDKFIIE